ncbi:hypothetical protein [Mucilaginibacter myungsuensis]|uniref:Uncharacterized protein n=1 Tax=Mucilaginibacter myungsuensis TaxID=649104 RepID=A0A929PUW4_9SPHI|nr:hypothetical protein [Mucilaginibacter myungsuensis]MBE9660514.1 hypothetical protein [Mucilaginibacter myungsuensis]MDN3600558.1 hypothetical protein [Mucilaginibacter myungsuensis]
MTTAFVLIENAAKDINFWWIGGVAVFAILLISWVIWHNYRDQEEFKRELYGGSEAKRSRGWF